MPTTALTSVPTSVSNRTPASEGFPFGFLLTHAVLFERRQSMPDGALPIFTSSHLPISPFSISSHYRISTFSYFHIFTSSHPSIPPFFHLYIFIFSFHQILTFPHQQIFALCCITYKNVIMFSHFPTNFAPSEKKLYNSARRFRRLASIKTIKQLWLKQSQSSTSRVG